MYQSESTAAARPNQIMATAGDSPRDIDRALSSRPDGSDASGRLLGLFADASSHFIGELGFSTMLFRCAQSVVADFPWIPTDARERGIRQLSKIDSLIDAQGAVQARRVRIRLFNCFAEFLTLMIGERATFLIFQQAFARVPGALHQYPDESLLTRDGTRDDNSADHL